MPQTEADIAASFLKSKALFSMQTTVMFALLAAFSGPVPGVSTALAPNAIQLIQTTPVDDAHTPLTLSTPDPGRAGQVYQLPQGGVGVTTGGTSHYQTLTTPGGSGIAVPNGNGTSSLTGPGGRGGTATTPR